MARQIVLSGVGATTHGESLHQSFTRGRPVVIGIASAFVSITGVEQLVGILRRCGRPACRLIAGTDNAVTHPEALYEARSQGWDVRLGTSRTGIFHAKLVVGGQSFTRTGTVSGLCCVYVGSSNLTRGGLGANVECGMVEDCDGCVASASDVFAELWNAATPATEGELRHYAARFAERARRRAVAELLDLGISDSHPMPSTPSELLKRRPPSRGSLSTRFAVAAWAGLQSFTGEYRFQLEFPRDAGIVVNQLIGARAGARGRIDVYCPDDEATRPMQYRFYADNDMFRLNIPNDTPGVEWAREHRDGLGLVEQGLPGGAPLRLRLVRPGDDATEIVARSVALGTWGRTSTRAYGWYLHGRHSELE